MPLIIDRKQGGHSEDRSGLEFVPLSKKTPYESSQNIMSAGEGEAAHESKLLRRSWESLAFDCFLALLPPVFLALLIAAALQHEKPESNTGDLIQDALLLSPTIFPIIFAAICGKTMKSIALYKSQDGMSLRLLEHLSGASSLFSALERVYLLRNFGVIGIITTFVWALSPLGGQALSPRLLSKENFYSNSTRNATYFDPNFLGTTRLDSASGGASAVAHVTALYLTSLSSSAEVRSSPRDVWGNPKTSIPYALAEKSNASEWTDLTISNATSSYTNLIGVPVKAFENGVASEIILPSINLEIKCSSLQLTDTESFKRSLKEPLLTSFAGGGTFPNGTTTIEFHRGFSGSGASTTFLYMTNTSWTRFVSDITQPITIFYGSRTWETKANVTGKRGLSISLAECTMVPRGLETKLSCNGQVCHAIAARQQPAVVTKNVTWTINSIMKRGYFCGMGASGRVNEAGQTEQFISSGSVGESNYDLLNLWDMPLADFEERFQQMVNTFWYAAASQVFSTGNFSSKSNQQYVSQTPAAVTVNLGPHYICHWVWFGLAVAIVLLLEGLAVANAILRFRTRAPDIFGYVSSLTIGNRYCESKGLGQSSALFGLERARALGRVRFQLADIKGGEDVGRIAFFPRLSEEGLRQGYQDDFVASRVKFNRYYD
ncbi:uncharacterized protein CTRU02_213329 [Colletotrichum truncatum]|uniref:Uncharacterized protein n=1 Tax=Colletotrichum truncatum TaxID=5467 RepID=A0ACC3YKY2_COLTU|nr:uncharacterized protein CTRU02_02259 [Colletotrichum truncatum]KAF6798286.1 hypothetical protein CTRU02_02259 [Colletotrichum truncatum]